MLLIHARRFRYRAVRKAVRSAENLDSVNGSLEAENTLVVYVTVEKSDEASPTAIVEKACREILDVYGKVKARSIILYPYAHLSSSLASPEKAVEILGRLEEALRRESAAVHRAPFGWYKEFLIECYGHPLSELSRSIEAAEAPQPSYYSYVPGEGLRLLGSSSPLKTSRSRVAERAVELCGRFGCDPRDPWVLRGRASAMMRLAESRVESMLGELVGEAEKLDLGCLDENPSECSMPWRKLIQARAAGAERLLVAARCMHPGCSGALGVAKPSRILGAWIKAAGMDEAVEAMLRALRKSRELVPGIRGEELLVVDVDEEGLSRAEGILEAMGMRGVVRAWRGRCGDGLTVKLFCSLEGLLASKASITIASGREGSAEVFIQVPRSLEDLLYMYMVKAAVMEAEGATPMLPQWLSPIQVRIIPLGEENMGYAEAVASMLREKGVRVDVDTGGGGLGRRIRRAGLEWIPYIVVVGGRERETGTINVRIRAENKQVSMKPEELLGRLEGSK